MTHNYLLLFTEQGKCHWLRVYEVPEASKTATGRVIQNIIQLPKDDKVKAYVIIEDLKDEDFLENHFIIFCTKKGQVKKTPMEQFSRPRTNGIIAISISEGDNLIEAKLTTGSREIVLANKKGRAIRFNESKVRSMGRNAGGVRGMMLETKDDSIVGMLSLDLSEDKTILVVSEKGNGKRSLIEDYRLTNRGGKGVKSMKITEKTGDVVSIKAVSEDDDLMITSKSGIVIRLSVSDVRVMGRATQGVRVIRLSKGEEIADLAVVSKSDEIEDAEVIEGEEGIISDENSENAGKKGISEEE